MGKRDFENSTVDLDWFVEGVDEDGKLAMVRDTFAFPRAPVGRFLHEIPPPLDMIVAGLKAGTVGNVVAPGSTGKGFFALQIACAIAAKASGMRAESLGIDIQKGGKVVIFSAEDDQDVIWHRLHDIGVLFPDEVHDALERNVEIVPAVAMGIDLASDVWIKRIRREVKSARVVIIDTLTRVHTLDENSAKDAKILMGNMECIAVTGPAVIFNHHISKATALGGMGNLQQAARGSSVLVDNARWSSFLAGMSPEEAKHNGITDEERPYYVRWNVSKQNYGRPLVDRWLKRCDNGVLLSEGAKHIASDGGKGKGTGKGEGQSQSRRNRQHA
jgi:RecA-family ATPase